MLFYNNTTTPLFEVDNYESFKKMLTYWGNIDMKVKKLINGKPVTENFRKIIEYKFNKLSYHCINERCKNQLIEYKKILDYIYVLESYAQIGDTKNFMKELDDHVS